MFSLCVSYHHSVHIPTANGVFVQLKDVNGPGADLGIGVLEVL